MVIGNPMLQLLDVTIRDGSYVVDFQYTPSQVARIIEALDRAGIPYAEIGHGMGLGASKIGFMAAASDEVYVKVARKCAKQIKLGVLLGAPPATRPEDIETIRKDIDFVRVAANADDIRPVLPFVRLARRLKLEVFFQMMRSSRMSEEKLLTQMQRVEDAGAHVVYVVDTGGFYVPEQVASIVSHSKQKLSIGVGFHGHNNLGLAMANALAAVDAGADFVDASLRGMGRGAGNTQMEALVVLLQRRGLARKVRLDVLLKAAERFVDPLMPPYRGVKSEDVVTAASHIDLYPISYYEKLSEQLGISFPQLVRRLGKTSTSAEIGLSDITTTIRSFGGDPRRLLPRSLPRRQKKKKKSQVLLAVDIPLEEFRFPKQYFDQLQKRFPDTTFSLTSPGTLPPEELQQADAVWSLFFSTDLLQQARSLCWFHCLITGVDHLPLSDFARKKIQVTIPHGAAGPTIAETVVGGILLFYRKIYESILSQMSQKWMAKEIIELVPPFRELRGSTVGIVGCGSIGMEVARACKRLGARVLALKRSKGFASPWVDELLTPAGLPRLLTESDAIVLACPLTSETHHMIGPREFRRMKSHAVLINVARGALVDEKALIEALDQGRIGGALFDSFIVEPLPDGHPLFQTPSFVVMPHVAGLSQSMWPRLFESFLKNLICYLEGRPLPDLVDLKRGY